MIYGIQSEDTPVTVTFTDAAGQPAIPDANSVTYSVRLNDGTLDPERTDVPVDLDPTDVQATITIDDAITGQIETRTLIVNYRRAAVPRSIRVVVKLVQYSLHWLTPGDVRGFLGVSESELPDDDIDLHRAYIEAQNAVGIDELTDAFTTNAIKANDLVMCRAVLNVLPSLELRVAQSETNGTKAFARLSKLNLDRLYAYVVGLYGSLVGTLSGASVVAPTLLVLSTQPDPITGT